MPLPMTSLERRYGGARFDYWPDQDSIDNNWPRLWECQRADLVDIGLLSERVQLHGRTLEIDTAADRTYGQPTPDYSSYPFGPLELSDVPAIGMLTWRPADTLSGIAGSVTDGTRITVARDGNLPVTLAVNTWRTLTGGTALPALGGGYNGTTGELTIVEAGIYSVSLSISLVGTLSTGVDMTVAVNGAQSALMARAASGNLHCSAELELLAGAVLTPSLRSTLALSFSVSDFVLSVRS